MLKLGTSRATPFVRPKPRQFSGRIDPSGKVAAFCEEVVKNAQRTGAFVVGDKLAAILYHQEGRKNGMFTPGVLNLHAELTGHYMFGFVDDGKTPVIMFDHAGVRIIRERLKVIRKNALEHAESQKLHGIDRLGKR